MANQTSEWRTGRPSTWRSALSLAAASVRPPGLRQRGNLFYVALVLQLAGVGLLAWIGWVHWVLWHYQGYHFIPTDGPFFLVDAIAGGVLAVVLVTWARPVV